MLISLLSSPAPLNWAAEDEIFLELSGSRKLVPPEGPWWLSQEGDDAGQ
jgi:hypothetical protein